MVLVTIDTLRADHLGVYGYGRNTSPTLDRLGSEGAMVERAYSQSNSTNPSHATILTGLPVKSHGVTDNRVRFAREDVQTLAESFSRVGYQTAAVVSVGHLNETHSGLGRGFETFVPVRPRHHEDAGVSPDWTRSARASVDVALDWVQGVDEGPFFLWVHLFDPHTAYVPEPEFAAALAGERVGRVATMDALYHHEITPGDALAKNPDATAMEDSLYRAVYRHVVPIRPLIYNGVDLTVAEVASLRRLYDAEIAQTDAAVASLLAGVSDRNPLCVVTADHGENFGKGGVYCDHRSLYEDSIRVPLLFHWPGRISAGLRIPGPLVATDLVPTLLDLCGLEGGADLPGESIAAALLGTKRADAPRPFFVEHANGAAVAMIDGSWKLILPTFTGDDPLVYRHAGVELYRLDEDPGEESNQVESEPDRTRQMTEAVLSWMSEGRVEVEPVATDPSVVRQLRSLGYVE